MGTFRGELKNLGYRNTGGIRVGEYYPDRGGFSTLTMIKIVGRPPGGNWRTSVTSVDSIGQMARGAASHHMVMIAHRMPEVTEML